MTTCEIRDVPTFDRNHDAGSMAMLALEAILAAQGERWPAWWLAGMSGDAFKFVYDAGAVFEPLRDRVPLDVLTLACQAAGGQDIGGSARSPARLWTWFAHRCSGAARSSLRSSAAAGITA